MRNEAVAQLHTTGARMGRVHESRDDNFSSTLKLHCEATATRSSTGCAR